MHFLKYSFFATLLIVVVGCGITSKDSFDDKQAKDLITIYNVTDKGISISHDNGATWGSSIQKGRVNRIASSVFNDLLIADKTTYIATDKGLSLVTANNQEYVTLLSGSKINSLGLFGDKLFVAAADGLYVVTANINITKKYDKPVHKVLLKDDKIYLQQEQIILVSTKNNTEFVVTENYNKTIVDFGLVKAQLITLLGDTLFIGANAATALPQDKYSALYCDPKNGSIWVAGEIKLYRSSDYGTTWLIYDKDSGLDVAGINYIYADNLNIYLATNNGLVHSKNGGESWHLYQRQAGLLSNYSKFILVK